MSHPATVSDLSRDANRYTLVVLCHLLLQLTYRYSQTRLLRFAKPPTESGANAPQQTKQLIQP